jgi:hypothetical protein
VKEIPKEFTDALAELHEFLGDTFLDLMRGYGVAGAPVVVWQTEAPGGVVVTSGVIMWEDSAPEVVRGFDVDLLAGEVARRVIARLGSGN